MTRIISSTDDELETERWASHSGFRNIAMRNASPLNPLTTNHNVADNPDEQHPATSPKRPQKANNAKACVLSLDSSTDIPNKCKSPQNMSEMSSCMSHQSEGLTESGRNTIGRQSP